MTVPLPAPDRVKLGPPGAEEVEHLGRGVVSAITPEHGITELQRVLVAAMFESMTDHRIDPDGVEPIEPASFALGLADRNEAFRTRIVQIMLLGALVLRPLPASVADRVSAFAHELDVDDDVLEIARRASADALGLAAVDFDRNGYTADWSAGDHHALHTSTELAAAWDSASDDPALAARWCALEQCPPGSLGRGLFDFYRSRGFTFPGLPGSAPPLLAQHDWVHVLADYGTTVESELEVFAFLARANDDPRAFSLLAMVVSLFETGALSSGAGLFQASPGNLSHEGMAVRLAEAMRRGAECEGSIDFLGVDWFELAGEPLEDVRVRFGVRPRSARASDAGSVGPWEPGGISAYQWRSGQEAAAREGRPYDAAGAAVA